MSPIPCPEVFLCPYCLGERCCHCAPGHFCRRTLYESAAEHARLSRSRVVEHAGLAGRDALLARDEFDLIAVRTRAQPRRLRRTRRAHAHEHLDAVADHLIPHAVTDPVDVA